MKTADKSNKKEKNKKAKKSAESKKADFGKIESKKAESKKIDSGKNKKSRESKTPESKTARESKILDSAKSLESKTPNIACKRVLPAFLDDALESIACEKMGARIMRTKGEMLLFIVENLSISALMILKQELLSAGGDLATPREAILCERKKYRALVIATKAQLARVIEKCKIQPFGLRALALTLESHVDSAFAKRAKYQAFEILESTNQSHAKNAESKNQESKNAESALDSASKSAQQHATQKNTSQKYTTNDDYIYRAPLIMPIINLTPDSFHAPSRKSSAQAIESIESLITQGATLIDIGAASSRPGSELIDYSEEIARIKEVCAFIKKEKLYKKACFSIDTYNPECADYALDSGFEMVNDVSGISNKQMFKVIERYRAQVVLMHSRGTPKDMARLTSYDDLILDIDAFFAEKIARLQDAKASAIILDIGFGFAKDVRQNLALIQNLEHFKHFSLPLLVGASNKSTIGEITGQKATQDRLSGTLALHLIALQNGANIIRAHDFVAHRDMLRIYEALRKSAL